MARLKVMGWGLVALVVFAVAGCAPSTASKPEAGSAAGPNASKGQASGAQSGATREGATTPGSLDELQKGRSTAAGPLKDVFFDYDRYDLQADARATLKTNADWLKKNPAARVEIEGHCDERGTSEYNLALGAKRAQAAKDYLVTLGIAGARLSTISYGEEIPVCKQQREDCWRQNRRARFVVIASRPAS